MSGRRKPNSGDFGPSGVARLLSLVSRPLRVSILATRRAIAITLTDYLRVKSGGGANQGFRARIAEFTGGATQRIILALRGDLRESVTLRALGGQGVGQLCTWLQFHQVPRAASAAVAAGIVVGALGDAATPEIVAGLIACRTEQILPAIEDYLYKQKGLDRGDVD